MAFLTPKTYDKDGNEINVPEGYSRVCGNNGISDVIVNNISTKFVYRPPDYDDPRREKVKIKLSEWKM
jgi:hypothetical protein